MGRKKSSDAESDLEWDEDSNISYNSVKKRSLMIGLMAVIIIVSAGVVYAAISLSLKETAPSISNAPPLLSGCDPLTATPSSVPTGSSGGILFTCGPQGTILGALTVNGPVTASLGFSPSPTGYTAIFVLPQGTQCSQTTTNNMQIFGSGSASSISFTNTATSQYDYCGTFSNAPSGGFPAWTITWTWTQ